jgi:hypothetical protein
MCSTKIEIIQTAVDDFAFSIEECDTIALEISIKHLAKTIIDFLGNDVILENLKDIPSLLLTLCDRIGIEDRSERQILEKAFIKFVEVIEQYSDSNIPRQVVDAMKLMINDTENILASSLKEYSDE